MKDEKREMMIEGTKKTAKLLHLRFYLLLVSRYYLSFFTSFCPSLLSCTTQPSAEI